MVESQMFTLGTVATTSEHRFIYDIDNGYFFYDSDGTGENGLVKIAQLDSGLNLDKSDLSISL